MKVIFFDGVCGLCNGFVDFIMKIDKKKQFKFSPLQSDFAQKNLPPELTKDLKTVVYWQDGKITTKSKAVLQILKDVGGLWALASIGNIVPNFLRDALYNAIAKNRYNLFGRKETCRLPTPEERSRFVS